jgi:RNA polymerase sigma-70 factor (sigma-E family)
VSQSTVAADFDEFVAVELPRLLGLARALSRDEHDAWDLVQETLARVGTRWSRLDRGHAAAGYARTVLVRLNIDRLRRLRREWPSSQLQESAVEPTAADGVDPWLARGLRDLSPRQRTAIVLRFAEDLDLATIAARMGCSVGTAKSHLSRGLDRLRQHAPTDQRTVTKPRDSR